MSGDSVINDRYLYTAGGIKHNGSVTGTIIATCSVPDDLGTVAAMGVTYTDSDGTGTNHHVEVKIKRTDKVTGSVATIDTFISNSFSATSLTYQTATVGHSMDNVDYYYYLDIDLTRASGTATASIRAIELQY